MVEKVKQITEITALEGEDDNKRPESLVSLTNSMIEMKNELISRKNDNNVLTCSFSDK